MSLPVSMPFRNGGNSSRGFSEIQIRPGPYKRIESFGKFLISLPELEISVLSSLVHPPACPAFKALNLSEGES